MWKKAEGYLRNSYVEITQKVSWPARAQVRASAFLVIIASLIFALIIGGVDSVFKGLMQEVYKMF